MCAPPNRTCCSLTWCGPRSSRPRAGYPLETFPPDDRILPCVVAANTWQRTLFALPWFIDVGMLYCRTDLAITPASPADFETLRGGLSTGTPSGFVWQGARYEGLVTVFLEHLGAFGGRILDDNGRVVLDSRRRAWR